MTDLRRMHAHRSPPRRCADAAEALRALADLPLVKPGIIEFEAIPLGPFANFEILFAPAE